jgi:hypothetical protein
VVIDGCNPISGRQATFLTRAQQTSTRRTRCVTFVLAKVVARIPLNPQRALMLSPSSDAACWRASLLKKFSDGRTQLPACGQTWTLCLNKYVQSFRTAAITRAGRTLMIQAAEAGQSPWRAYRCRQARCGSSEQPADICLERGAGLRRGGRRGWLLAGPLPKYKVAHVPHGPVPSQHFGLARLISRVQDGLGCRVDPVGPTAPCCG